MQSKCRGMKSTVVVSHGVLWVLSSLSLLSKRAWSAELADGRREREAGLICLGRAIGWPRFLNLP